MRTRARRRWRFTCVSALGLGVALWLLGSAQVAGQGTSESWKELPGGLAPTDTPDSPVPKPVPPKPAPTMKPTPNPNDRTKFPTANNYACEATKELAKDLIDKIEGKAASGDKTVYPGEAEYRAAFNKAKAEKKDGAAATEAARKAVEDGIVDGSIKDKGTGETFADKARREWEGAKRGNKVPDPDTTLPGPGSKPPPPPRLALHDGLL